MKEKNLSKRLQQVADFVEANSVIADIGSDHGYLPVYLILEGIAKRAICGEVVKGPFQQTLKEVAKLNLQDKISVRLADGLQAIEKTDEISVISICGMGGKLIVDILETGKEKLANQPDLLLQPNLNEPLVREWLTKENYQIVKEAIVEDNHKVYEVMYAKKSKTPVTLKEHEILLGPLLLQEKSPVFMKKWQRVLKNKEMIIKQLQQADQKEQTKIQEFQNEVIWIKEWV